MTRVFDDISDVDLDTTKKGANRDAMIGLAPIVGLEPTTLGLTVPRSTS